MKTIKNQIKLVKEKTDNLIKNFSKEHWHETPSVLESNLNWQIGHIILANYLHGIASISGANEEYKAKVNIPNFIKYYGPKSDPKAHTDEKPSHEELLEMYDFTFSTIYKGIENLSLDDLENKTEIPNPAATTKYEALLLLSQHQSWHNGQIAVLNRVLNS
ncbi:DinB family protein [Aureivirga sp. CE67]|uniref:DinB family protein n=1 Tax=Aureivirga sp. CE67 TaxID=1788983 RepID=UPI0018CA5FF4|nr:DinB family protein [Aureivirga sp. CE67]